MWVRDGFEQEALFRAAFHGNATRKGQMQYSSTLLVAVVNLIAGPSCILCCFLKLRALLLPQLLCRCAVLSALDVGLVVFHLFPPGALLAVPFSAPYENNLRRAQLKSDDQGARTAPGLRGHF